MLSVDLGIEEKYKPIIERHSKFFNNKERTQRFYNLEIETLTGRISWLACSALLAIPEPVLLKNLRVPEIVIFE